MNNASTGNDGSQRRVGGGPRCARCHVRACSANANAGSSDAFLPRRRSENGDESGASGEKHLRIGVGALEEV